jgi:hypothetical protein
MRHFKILGLGLLAVFALSVSLASSASASLPALYQCGAAVKVGKTYVGHYTNKKCTVASKVETGGKYEFEEWRVGSKETGGKKGKVKAFKGKGSGANLEVQGQSGISCTKSSDTGIFTGPKTGEGTATFTGCETAGLKCTSGSVVGEIKTNVLAGEVGYIAGKGTEHPIVGIDFKPKTGSYLAEFHCQDLNVKVSGSVIGEVAPPYNEFTKEATFVFEQTAGTQRCGGKGKLSCEELEGGIPDTLLTQECKSCEGGGLDPSAQEGQFVNKGEELMLEA